MRSLRRNKEMVMLLQQDTDHIDISYNAYALTLAGLEKQSEPGSPALR